MIKKTILVCVTCLLTVAHALHAEDGHRLWLRLDTAAHGQVSTKVEHPAVRIAVAEIRAAWHGQPVRLVQNKKLARTLTNDGFRITSTQNKNVDIEAATPLGLLYGTYHLLRLQATDGLSYPLFIEEKPAYQIRILNHWDNLDRTVERGYAGKSIWDWEQLPDTVSSRYAEYARANASIGINASVLNNVNANPQILTTAYLTKVKALANIFRPYGIKVYLSVNFASPIRIGGLKTADPLDQSVRDWWKTKANEIYRLIPDFGGFLVKANSEGQSGPQDYGRTHADGANMLADVLQPHGGVVMWRAFVYNPTDEDRAKQAYQEFVPLDGQFRDNVIIQVKNGPVDFQPREPFSSLFGAMKKTPVMAEFQITQEYLGFANHVAYLGTLWKECLDSDTYQFGEHSTVARVTDGSCYPQRITALSGVANIGDDVNWCGHPLAQANWYAFGRLAWNHQLSAEAIAREWVRQTYGTDAHLEPLVQMLITSRETVVRYMMPLGLHHIFATGHHYGPEPWSNIPGMRPDWQPPYYHKADLEGIGFDRTEHGSNAVSQYHEPLRTVYNDLKTCPENLLLWFHHVSWTHRMASGRTLWDEMCHLYDQGVREARHMQTVWDTLEPYMDAQRFKEVQYKLKIQARDAVWWKDGCLLYFQTFSKQPIPSDIERPIHDLDALKRFRLRISNHENAPMVLN